MDKGVARAVRAGAGRLVDQLGPVSGQAGHNRLNIVDRDAQVVHSRAAPGQVLGHAAVGRAWLQQLDLALPQGQEGDAHGFLGIVFHVGQG